nr:Chain C, MHC Class I H13a minor histocompatibility peptide [synthetic construct]
SSVVGVWYL